MPRYHDDIRTFLQSEREVDVSHIIDIPDTRSIHPDLMSMWRERWPNFQPYELDSRDWSLRVDIRALDALQDIRIEWGRAMRITSAYRNPAHNRAVGGASRSQHLITTAFDIAIRDSDEGREIEAIAKRHGAKGIGRYPKSLFIHLDWREGRQAGWGRWV